MTSQWQCDAQLDFGFFLSKIPLVAILISSIVAASWVTAWIVRMHNAARISSNQPTANHMVYYPCKNPKQMAIRSNR